MIIKEISEIKPDKDQPRKTFDNESLRFLSESILGNGLLKPIEIDENNIIIDGERRWKACKLAKIKEVEVRMVKIGKNGGKRLRRQLVADIQDEEIPTGERYEAIVKLWELEGKSEHAHFCKSIGLNTSTFREARDYVYDKREKPSEVKGFSAGMWREVRDLPKDEKEEIKKELEKDRKERKAPIVKLIEEKREKIQTKKQLEELKKRNEEIKQAKKWEIKVTTTKEVLDDIKKGIYKTHQELSGLMSRIRRIRRTKFYLYKAKDKDNFLKFLDGASNRARKWANELDDLKETISLEIVRE